jgi:hypothetical protein
MDAEEEIDEDDNNDSDGNGDDEHTEGDDRMMKEEFSEEVQDVEMSLEDDDDVIKTETSYQEVGGEHETDSFAQETLPLGFTMCWDNVGKKVITRRPNENVKNRYINMALGYIAVNRVPSTHLPWKNEKQSISLLLRPSQVKQNLEYRIDKY